MSQRLDGETLPVPNTISIEMSPFWYFLLDGRQERGIPLPLNALPQATKAMPFHSGTDTSLTGLNVHFIIFKIVLFYSFLDVHVEIWRD